MHGIWDSTVNLVTRLCAEQSGVRFLAGQEILLFPKMPRISLRSTQLPIQ
jgi:hypothetical protein